MNSPWQRRIARAQELRNRYAFAAEILSFYVQIARFQENFQQEADRLPQTVQEISAPAELTLEESSALRLRFESFLSIVQVHGPATLAHLSDDLRARGPSFWSDLLTSAWSAPAPSDATTVLAQAFLQPCAELLRSRTQRTAFKSGLSGKFAICPFCTRKPCVGVLRQMGDGAARSMVCSFCVAEWDFRRLVCPACGEENDTKLPVFTASDFDYIRVECCETCKTYIKSVDLTKDGHAEPIVDDLASAALDLWARERGYAKLHANLLGM